MMEHVPDYLMDILWLVGLLLLSWIVSRLIYRVLLGISKEWSHWEADDLIQVKRPILFIIIIVAIQVYPFIRSDIELPGWQEVARLLQIFSIAWLLISFVKVSRSVLLRRYDISSRDNLKARKITTQLRVFERIIVVVIVIIAVGVALMTFESIREIGTSILASAGIAGVIMGIAAQRLLANLFAGFQLAITQPIRLDDVVIVENEWGRIEEITLTYVVINIWDQRRLIVPSTFFIEKPFQNWTRKNSELLGSVFLYLDYSVSIDVIREELNRLLKETELWDQRVAVVQVTDASEKTMTVRILVSAIDSGTAWDLRVFIREKMINFLQEKYPESLPRHRIENK